MALLFSIARAWDRKVLLVADAYYASGKVITPLLANGHPAHLTKMIADAIEWKGFAFVEVMQHCHVLWGRRNGMPEAMDMMRFYKDHAVLPANVPEDERFDIPIWAEDERKVKFVLGALHKEAKPEFTEEYAKLRAKAQAKMAGKVQS